MDTIGVMQTEEARQKIHRELSTLRQALSRSVVDAPVDADFLRNLIASIEQEVQTLNTELERRVEERFEELQQTNLSLMREIDERRQSEDELRQSLRREKLTRRLLQFMNHSTDVEFILRVVAQEIGLFFEVDRCLVIYHEEQDPRKLRLVAQYCRQETIPPVHEEEIPWPELIQMKERRLDNEHPAILLNAPGPEHFPASIRSYLEAQDVQSIFVIEIRYRNTTYGRVSLHQCMRRRTWLKAEIDFLEALMPYIGATLYQAELKQQQKRAKQEAEEANQQKTKLLSYVAHDFKNPLSSILRFIEILESDKEEPLSPGQGEIIGYISEGIHLLNNMVKNILDKARLEEGKVLPSPHWIELSTLVEEIRFLLNFMASQRNVTLYFEIQPELRLIKADSTHLRQILVNLVSNAIKYNRPDGKVWIRFSKAEDGQWMVIEVEDTGIGISAEKIPMLFNEYYRADLSQSALVEGSGLGLAFVKKMVELYRGEVDVKSEEGVGSTFRVLLPLTRNNEIISSYSP